MKFTSIGWLYLLVVDLEALVDLELQLAVDMFPHKPKSLKSKAPSLPVSFQFLLSGPFESETVDACGGSKLLHSKD